MARRHLRSAPIYEYQPLHITAAGTVVPVGTLVNTTASTAVSVAGSTTITPTSMTNIVPGLTLNISHGTGTAEDVVVVSVTASTFTAVFANTHSGTYNICSTKGTFTRGFNANTFDTVANTVTLYNGNPNAYYPGTTTAFGTAFAVLKLPTSGVPIFLDLPGVVDRGLFYTVSAVTTSVDYTIWYADEY